MSKKIKIAFDLDGVIIDKPPLIPKRLLEWLFRGGRQNGLHYRFPTTRLERTIRKISHFYLFRPPIKENIKLIKDLAKDKRYEPYIVSGRYSFLKDETERWLKKRKIDGFFKKVFINLSDEQPHLFKEKKLKEIGAEIFVDDDEMVVDYLVDKLKTRVFCLEAKKGKKETLASLFLKNKQRVKIKMKILVGITYYYPNISGLSIYAKRLAEGLVKKGHQVTVLTSWYDRSLPGQEYINGVKVNRCPVQLKIGKGVFMLTLPFRVFALTKEADIINCHLPQFESFVFAVIGKIYRKKVILTHHTDLSGWKGVFNRLSEAAVWFGQIIAGMFADKIVPYTKDYADHSWYLQLFKNKLEFILPPIVVAKVDKNIQKRMIQKIGKAKYIIGFAGRVAKQKGIPYLINSIPYLNKDLKNFKIVFAGPHREVIGEKYFEEINSLTEKYNNFLVFLGNVPEEQMSSFYSLCDVLVLPSDDRLESFGLVQVEAMLNGCPVVATDLPGVRMPIKITKMGEVVAVGNTEKLAEGIIGVVKNRKKYIKRKGEIKKVFSFQKTLSDYEKLFKGN